MTYTVILREGEFKTFKVVRDYGVAVQYAIIWLSDRHQTVKDVVFRPNGKIEITTTSGVYGAACYPEDEAL